MPKKKAVPEPAPELEMEPVPAAEAAEEAVLNALAAAEPTTGYDGTVCHALCEYRDLL